MALLYRLAALGLAVKADDMAAEKADKDADEKADDSDDDTAADKAMVPMTNS